MERSDKKPGSRLIIGLMSGTSADGVDAALVEITGCSLDIQVEQRGFVTLPFPGEIRDKILQLAGGEWGGSRELCLLNSLLGSLWVEACLAVCEQAGVDPEEVDLVGSHGQTLWHQPEAVPYLDRMVRGTLQIGDPSLISERLGCPVVSDFRVRDMVAGGLGAPLVPYTEYLLYRDPEHHVALQNIGGIGNITGIAREASLDEVFAFDTGPGNMILDQLASRLTQGRLSYDADGLLAAGGKVHPRMLRWMMADDYLKQAPPKTTGRERYGETYLRQLLARAAEMNCSLQDVLATATRFTAETIACGIRDWFPFVPDRLVVAGGGARNPTLLGYIRQALSDAGIRADVLTGEQLGIDSEAKEAVAFAILASEAINGIPNNAPGATGAAHPVVMGKISY